MSIIHINGFGRFPVSGDAITLGTAPTTGTSSWTRETGRYGGYALRHTNLTNSGTSGNYANRIRLMPPVGLEFSLGVAVNHRNNFSASSGIVGFELIVTSNGWEVQLGTGVANAYTNHTGTSAWTVVDPSFTGIGWHWWNWVFKSHTTAGICQVYRDGVLIAQTGTDTVPSITAPPWASFTIYMGNANGGAQADIGDLIIKDDATTIPDSIVSSLFPDSTSAAAWLGSDADSVNNHLLIDENPSLDTADYVSSGTVNALDTYGMSNLPNTASSVHAVQATARAGKLDRLLIP